MAVYLSIVLKRIKRRLILASKTKSLVYLLYE